MRKLLVILLLMATCMGGAWAGDRDRFIGINVGVLHPKVFDITAAYEWETRYHNAWEMYLDVTTQWKTCETCNKVCWDSFWKNRNSFAVGLAYKPQVVRSRNWTVRGRLGADVGTHNRHFGLGIEAGLEAALSLRNRVQLVLQQKNEVTFWGKPTWKNGLLVGIKIPLN